MNRTLKNSLIDAIDVETFISCSNEEEAKNIMLSFLKEIGFVDSDIVFVEHQGLGARVRARGYAYKPGDTYGWLE